MKESLAKKISLTFGAFIMLSPIVLTLSVGLIWGAVDCLSGNSLKTQSLNPPEFNPICSAKSMVK